MATDRTQILILNYNGRALLAECLPSVMRAAERASARCRVSIVDNGSIDGSLEELAERWPSILVHSLPNDGLASFNTVLRSLDEPVVLLLNNDVKLDINSIDPLLDAIAAHPDALFAAPQCWTFDRSQYEGMRTRVRQHFGMIQGMCRVPGFHDFVSVAGLTAAAGPVLAVNRERFLELGGYDPMYKPGRIEDLDLGFAGWMKGWRGYYVPASLAFHKGAASFEPAFGKAGCDSLALRNTLLFAWKNLAGWRFWNHLAWLPARLFVSILRGRGAYVRAVLEALSRLPTARQSRKRLAVGERDWIERQEAYFQQFQW